MTIAEALRQLYEAQNMLNAGIELLRTELRGQSPPGEAQGLIMTGIAQLRRFEAEPFGLVCKHGSLLATCSEHHH